jgi:hypothetical protein
MAHAPLMGLDVIDWARLHRHNFSNQRFKAAGPRFVPVSDNYHDNLPTRFGSTRPS